mgnify:CR=1 FL=1
MASEIIEVLNAGRALECPLVPTRHARARMAERAITLDELQRTRMYGTVTRVRNGRHGVAPRHGLPRQLLGSRRVRAAAGPLRLRAGLLRRALRLRRLRKLCFPGAAKG